MAMDPRVAPGMTSEAAQPAGVFEAFARRFPPHIVFLVVGGLNAFLLAGLTPPFRVDDEFQHYFRAYELSEGRIWGMNEGGRPGDEIPISLQDFVRRTWGTLEVWKFEVHDERTLLDEWRSPHEQFAAEPRKFTEFLTAGYTPLFYVPQTLAFALGRTFDASPIALLLIGRLANAFAAIAVIAAALKLLPIGREMALAVALLPQAQFEYASLAPDASIIAAGFMLVAVVLRAGRQGTWSWPSLLLGALSAAILCAKVVYAPLLAVAAPAAFQSRERGAPPSSRSQMPWPRILIGAMALGATYFWTASNWTAMTSRTASGAAAAKIAAIAAHPLQFALLLVDDVASNGPKYFVTWVGIGASYVITLPLYVYLLATISFVLSTFLPRDDSGGARKLAIVWNVCLMVSVLVLTQTAMYAFFPTSEGFRGIFGVAGRYFLPLGAIMAATFASLFGVARFEHGKALGYALLIGIALVNTFALDWMIATRFG